MTTGRTTPTPVATTERTRWRAEGPAIFVHGLSMVVGFAVLLYCNRGQWFFGDEWAFLGHRGVVGAERGLWAPHSEHWSTGPILVYRALYGVLGVRTYVPYVVVLLLVHLAVTHLLWRVMRQAGIETPLATGLAATYVVLGAGYENLLWAFQIGFVGSVALGLGAVALVNHGGPFDRRDVAGWGLAVASLMFSGIGVTMVAVVTLTALFRRGWPDAARTLAVPALVFGLWLALAGREGLDAHPRTLDTVFSYPDYMWTGLRSAVEQATGLPGAGPVIVLGLAAWLVRRAGAASGRAAPAYAGAVGALLLFSVIAVGRTALGVAQSEAARYTYIALALALPALGLVLHDLVARQASRRAVVFFLLLMVAVHNVGVLRRQSRLQSETEGRFRSTVVAAADLASSPGEVFLDHQVDPAANPDLTVDDLRRLRREDKLPKVEVTPADRLSAVSALQYAVDESAPAPPSTPARVVRVTAAAESRARPGCVELTPGPGGAEIVLEKGPPMALTLTSMAGGELNGFLRALAPTVLTGPARKHVLQPGVAMTVRVTASVDEVLLRITGGGVTEICGVQ